MTESRENRFWFKLAWGSSQRGFELSGVDCRRIPSKGKQLPSYNQIHGWNIRNRNYILGQRFNKDSILDVRTHFKPTETFQYTNFCSCHPPGVTKGFIKGEALKFLRTNSSEITFEENMRNFYTHTYIHTYFIGSSPRGFSESILHYKIINQVHDNKNITMIKEDKGQ